MGGLILLLHAIMYEDVVLLAVEDATAMNKKLEVRW